MIELQTVTTKAKNPSTNEFQDVTWGGINVLSTSGTTNYNNLTNKPTINGVTVQGSLTTDDLLITAVDVGALPSGTKYGADFALSIDSQTFVVTAQLKDQDGNNLGQAKTIDLPLETMVVSGSYDDTTQKIILTLKNGQTVEFSVADLVSGLQSEITLSNKLDADLVSDASSENKFVTAAEKTAWNAKANASEVSVIANLGAKNLLQIMTQSQTVNGITFTINDDQTVTIDGTSQARAQFSLRPNAIYPGMQGCILNGAVQNNQGVTLRFQLGANPWTVYASDSGNGKVIQNYNDNSPIQIYIDVPAGVTVSNLVFRPMIRRAEIIDSTFVPYAKTNRELTVLETEDRTALVEQMNSGAKNLLRNIRETTTHKGITFTVAPDGIVTANGTNDGTGASILAINTQSNVALPNGNYVFSGCPQGGSTTGYVLDITRSVGSSIKDTGNGVEFVVGGDYTVNEFRIVINRGISVDNLVFKPMICTSADYAISTAFVPYAPTNGKLYETKTEKTETNVIANLGSKNNLLITNSNNTFITNGITFTKNADQTITATGTATANADYPLNQAQFLVIGKEYTLSGCPAGGGVDNFFLRQLSGAIDYGDGVTFTAESSSANFFIRIRNGYAIQGSLTFKPMLRRAEITDDTFQPYAPTNRELYKTKATIDDVYGYGSLIPANADLNDYTTPGRYYGSNDTGNTALNLPVANDTFTFSLEVKAATPSMTYQYIKICRLADDPFVYIRRKYNTWGSWYKFEGTTVASSTQSTAALMSAMPGKSAEITAEDETEESEMR